MMTWVKECVVDRIIGNSEIIHISPGTTISLALGLQPVYHGLEMMQHDWDLFGIVLGVEIWGSGVLVFLPIFVF